MIQRFIHNAINSYVTSIAGTIVGMPHIIEGFSTKNWILLIQGFGELIVGFASNERGIHSPGIHRA